MVSVLSVSDFITFQIVSFLLLKCFKVCYNLFMFELTY
jgi:hypothetical protein